MEVGGDGLEGDGLEEAGETDEHERRLNRKIDDILRRADEISARFERSRAGHRRGSAGEAASPSRSREGVEAGASAGLANLEGDLAPEDEGGAGAPGGGASAGSDDGADGRDHSIT